MSWTKICALGDIPPNAGVAALVGGEQVAVFNIDGALYAVANHDPFSGANVLSRGIVGNLGEETVVASPIYKQHFSLSTGQCLEDPEVSIATYEVRSEEDNIWLKAA